MKSKISEFLTDKKNQKWMMWGLAAFVAFQLYFVREMLAALLLFTAVFIFLATIAFAVYLLDEGSRFSVDLLAATSRAVAHFTRQSWLRIEEVTRKQRDRVRSAPAR